MKKNKFDWNFEKVKNFNISLDETELSYLIYELTIGESLLEMDYAKEKRFVDNKEDLRFYTGIREHIIKQGLEQADKCEDKVGNDLTFIEGKLKSVLYHLENLKERLTEDD